MKRISIKEDLEIPFSEVEKDGITRKKYEGSSGKKVTEDNKPFEDILTFMYFSRSRSSVKGVFESILTGDVYEMFLSDVEDLLIEEYRINSLEGSFAFVKRGANYGVILLEEDSL